MLRVWRGIEQPCVEIPPGENPDDPIIEQAVWVSPLGSQGNRLGREFSRKKSGRGDPGKMTGTSPKPLEPRMQ